MHDKYRVSSDDVYIVEVNGDGNVTTVDMWRGDEIDRHITLWGGEYPDKESIEKLVCEELDDPYVEVEAWVPMTVYFDLTETVSVTLNAFEEDEVDEIAYGLLETSFREQLLEKFREALGMDPYIEVGFSEDGAGGHCSLSDGDVKQYLKERE